jgi:putative MATE family efflux protein
MPIEPAETAESAYTVEVSEGSPTPSSPPSLGIWQLAWPAILANLLHALVGLVDIKIVGSLGAPAVAAVTTGNRIFFVLQAVLMAVTAGTTALVARAWGAGDRLEAARVTRASVIVCSVIALGLTVPALLLADPLARFFRLEEETVQLAATFIRWLSVFNVVFAVGFVLGTALRAAGDTRTPLWIGAFTNVINFVLVYSLVYGRLGLPALGVRGAAIANGASFSIGALVLFVLWVRGTLVVGTGSRGSVERGRVGRLLDIGYPAALEQGVWQAGFIGFLWVVALYGTAPYAAYGIGVSILAFSFVVGFGFAIAASTLVGQHLGAGDPAGASRSGWRATGLSVATMTCFGLAIIAASEEIATFMIEDPEVVRLTVVFIYMLGGVQPLMALEFTLGGALRGAGDTRFPLIAIFSGLVGARLSLAALFAWQGLGVEWVFGALIGHYIVTSMMLTARFRTGRWQHVIG